MIIDGSVSSEKTQVLIDKYAALLNSGVDASKILVLVQNSNLKNKFIEETLRKLEIDTFEKMKVYSFFGLVYNAIIDNWAFIENGNPFKDNPKILPNLAGLEVSQFVLKDILKSIPFKGYNSKKSLLHQLFRRYALIVQNNLTDDEVDWRAGVLDESFSEDAKAALKKLLAKTLYLRDFDYLRQGLVFNYIYKNTNYFKDIEYLILDDGDEITPICYDFVKHLAPQLKDVFVAYDSKGASRIGYLSADRTAVWQFGELFNQPVTVLDSLTKLKFDAENIFNNVVKNEKTPLKFFTVQSPSKRSSMIELVSKKINALLKEKVLPSEISIVTPVIDEMLKFSLAENLNHQAKPLYLSGSEKLIQNKYVLAAITILKFNTNLSQNLSEFDLRSVLTGMLGIPVKYCKTVLEEFDKNRTLTDYEFADEEYNLRYKNLCEIVKSFENSDKKLSEQVYEIYTKLFEFYSVNSLEINKFNFFIKQLQDFENVFGDEFLKRKEEIITQIENSIIAENPYSVLEISENDLVIGTPQKIIDNQIKTKYQFWLDISSDEWIKSDTGPLYNAWVFQRGWSKDEYTIDDNIELGREKTARILRKLTLAASENVFAYSSLFDGNGVENFGGIEEFIVVDEEILKQVQNDNAKSCPIIPRDDQKPVLDYEKGQMAISAVPGAGKTTILLALILKLLDKGINPDNIFVMTYMESAARNFRERIKSIRENSTQLPNISTIHGLALRILKENGNFERLGLSSDFDICDDTQRTRIVKEVAAGLKLKKTETDEFDRAISVFKIGGGKFETLKDGETKILKQVQDDNSKSSSRAEGNNAKIVKFQQFFDGYQKILKEANLIDYDDMLISSVRLLEENEDIRDYYQNICMYIIEDEAQDSSSVQQRLINLLSAKHKNLIRCGDINQAITTTFTNADVKGFRKFIAESQNVSMNCSQRCCEDVWKLANELLISSEQDDETKDAFFHILMNPVEGRNPVSENSIQARIFEKTLEEKNFVLKEIKNAFRKNPKATVGILLRNNFQVAQWTSFINDSGLKSITRSECLEQKSIFRAIFAVINMILNPFDNGIIADSYETLAELGFYKQRLGTEIRKYENPFVSLDCDLLENPSLIQFYWDVNYWLFFPHLTADELAIKIGLHYFDGEIEKSNIYLISTLIKRISSNTKNLAVISQRLGELAKRNSLSGFKFFSEEDESDRAFLEGKVQIMTLHKSKGDEFDYVFLPEMAEKNLTLDFAQIKLKSSDFMENVKKLNPNYKPKTEFEMKQELIAENLRLLYVAITRAKKYLYFTTSRKTKSFEKIINQDPSIIFEKLLGEVVVYE